ncbi:phage tail protein [uncultured Clostridium sp.]|uniref:phage tail protein n=1 Tax=uncultured Clostridium sp. TaxID=59620 RepID=UPI0026244EEE|nr:phage tail protein [uncultured Clostridium sp.]
MFKIRVKGINQDIICINKSLKLVKNQAAILTFELQLGSYYYNKLHKYLDYIEVTDEKNNILIFEGRVISSPLEMDDTGTFTNIVTCEGILNYFNDTSVGKWEFHPSSLPTTASKNAIANATVKTLFNKVIDNHNSKVEKTKQIQVGNIEINDSIFVKTNYETSLATMFTKIVDKHSGYLIIRNEKGINYLDFLINNPIRKVQNIELGLNMKSIEVDDSSNIFTRIIPFGKDGIDIKSVNNNCEYIQDSHLAAKYGIIEKVMNWDDVTIPMNLLNKASAAFSEVKLNIEQIKLTALDLSYIDNNFEKLKLFTPVRVINNVINYNNTHEIISINIDLDYPHRSTFDLNLTAQTSNNFISNFTEQANSNQNQLNSFGNELSSKTSNSDLENYKKQNMTLFNGNAKDLKEINSNIKNLKKEIDDKPNSDDFITAITTSMNKFKFILGEGTPLSITNNYLSMTLQDNSKFVLSADGMQHIVKDVKYNYYSLYFSDYIKVHSGEPSIITIPDMFKDKEYKILYSISNISPENATDCLNGYDIKILNNDKTNLKVTLEADIKMFNPRTETSSYLRGYGTITYTILA